LGLLVLLLAAIALFLLLVFPAILVARSKGRFSGWLFVLPFPALAAWFFAVVLDNREVGWGALFEPIAIFAIAVVFVYSRIFLFDNHFKNWRVTTYWMIFALACCAILIRIYDATGEMSF